MELRIELSMNEIEYMFGKISASTLVKLFPYLGSGLN
ncbi:hypothetical protein NMY3_00982 [Candidatus Nitrosocosmicus oleophilus]|uniref:Uncharacterized protein n=1 Tax=Candidatus Nitrosocosmicus oleophilus TaxID=1353260 RepID=A0A654LW21_9ARCH|nr:hypothetical protein NMY3_00982 [Candidatus Nitrosocosmicus oleophilus]